MAKLLLQFSGVEQGIDRAARSSILRLIAISGTIGTLAAKRATTSIPVVMLTIEGLPAPSCSICLLIRPTSIRSSRCSLSSKLCAQDRRRSGLYFSLLVRMQNEKVGSPGRKLR